MKALERAATAEEEGEGEEEEGRSGGRRMRIGALP